MKKRNLLLIVTTIFAFFSVALPLISLAQTPINFTNPLGFTSVQEFLDKIYSHLQGIIGVIAIIFIIIGGILYMTSGGDEGRIKTAKAAVTAAIIGLAIGVAAPSFLKEISIILGWTSTSTAPTLSQIALNVLNFLLGIIGVLAILMLIVGGITYITAAGDENRIDQGKRIVKYSIIGIAIALASLLIVKQIAKFFT